MQVTLTLAKGALFTRTSITLTLVSQAYTNSNGNCDVSMTASILRINVGDKLRMGAVVEASAPMFLAWTVTEETDIIDIDTVSLSPTSRIIGASRSNSSTAAASSSSAFSTTYSLAVGGGALSIGFGYSFRLSCYPYNANTGVGTMALASASITVKVNIPPVFGVLRVSPLVGYGTTHDLISMHYMIDTVDDLYSYSSINQCPTLTYITIY
jgi:hypothetical protein